VHCPLCGGARAKIWVGDFSFWVENFFDKHVHTFSTAFVLYEVHRPLAEVTRERTIEEKRDGRARKTEKGSFRTFGWKLARFDLNVGLYCMT
jgi:hypothetical protein